MNSNRLHIITGPPGSGKSTLIAALAAEGVAVSEEVGRRIIREQLAAGGDALPWDDERAFAALMLPREIAAREAALATGETMVLDRGVPDVIGFLRASGLPVPAEFDQAARTLRYNSRIFFAPYWPAIFVRDAERPRSAAYAETTHHVMADTYHDYGYSLVELPCASVTERVAFVLERL